MVHCASWHLLEFWISHRRRQPVGPASEQAATLALGDRLGAIIVMDPQTGRLRAVINSELAFQQSFSAGLNDSSPSLPWQPCAPD